MRKNAPTHKQGSVIYNRENQKEESMSKYEKVKVFWMGFITALVLVVLVAAAQSGGEVGRYQVVVADEGSVIVIDTKTSEIKTALGSASPGSHVPTEILSAMRRHWGSWGQPF